MSVIKIAYGTEDGVNYFVQTCCGEEHYGQDCDCKSYGESYKGDKARELAEELAKGLGVDCDRW